MGRGLGLPTFLLEGEPPGGASVPACGGGLRSFILEGEVYPDFYPEFSSGPRSGLPASRISQVIKHLGTIFALQSRERNAAVVFGVRRHACPDSEIGVAAFLPIPRRDMSRRPRARTRPRTPNRGCRKGNSVSALSLPRLSAVLILVDCRPMNRGRH